MIIFEIRNNSTKGEFGEGIEGKYYLGASIVEFCDKKRLNFVQGHYYAEQELFFEKFFHSSRIYVCLSHACRQFHCSE